MNEDAIRDAEPVPFIAYEAIQIRGDVREQRLHTNNRLLVILMSILFAASCAIMFFMHRRDMNKIEAINHDAMEKIAEINRTATEQIKANNQAWIDYIQQYDFEDYTYTQDGRGVNIMGDGNGVDFNGAETESDKEAAEKPK